MEEQLAEEEESYRKRLDAEAKALDKRLGQAQAAYDRELKEQQAADDLRIKDMQDDFEERKKLEDADRGVRLGRMADDHQDQLDELDRQQGARIAQIERHEAAARKQIDDEFQERLQDLGIQTDDWIKEHERLTDAAIADFDRWFDNLKAKSDTLIGPPTEPPGQSPWPSLSDPTPTLNRVSEQIGTSNVILSDILRELQGGARSASVTIATSDPAENPNLGPLVVAHMTEALNRLGRMR